MPDIKHLVLINAPSKKVFDAVTTQEGLSNWWTVDTKAEPKENTVSEFRFGKEFFNRMKITNLKPGKEVNWKCIEGDEEWIGTELTFTVSEKDGRTELKFEHNNWDKATDFFASCSYNWAWYLTSLKDYCEKGKGTPFPHSKGQ